MRDKRIQIEQLNTLLIKRSGLDAVLNTLNSWFGPYSQDPPYYANVERFQPQPELGLQQNLDEGLAWLGL